MDNIMPAYVHSASESNTIPSEIMKRFPWSQKRRCVFQDVRQQKVLGCDLRKHEQMNELCTYILAYIFSWQGPGDILFCGSDFVLIEYPRLTF